MTTPQNNSRETLESRIQDAVDRYQAQVKAEQAKKLKARQQSQHELDLQRLTSATIKIGIAKDAIAPSTLRRWNRSWLKRSLEFESSNPLLRAIPEHWAQLQQKSSICRL